jgi:tetratricopeptide (TPR) repeat protein
MKSAIRLCLSTCLLILVVSGNTFAQQTNADKLRSLISKETNDTGTIKLLFHINWFDTRSDTEQDRYLKEAYDLTVKKNSHLGMVYSYFREGLLLNRERKYEEAIEKYKLCINALDSMHFIQHMDGFPLWDIRLLFSSAGKQEEKFQYYSEKTRYYKQNGPKENLADCYHGIAGYYYYLGDYDKAIEYFLRARDAFISFDAFGSANDEAVVGKMYLEWGNLNKAEVYLKSALKLLISLKFEVDYFFCYRNLGDLCFKRHDYQGAMHYYLEGKKYWGEPTSNYVALNLVSIAAVHLQLDSRDSARFYLDWAESLRQKKNLGISFPQGNFEIDYTFYKYYLATGNQKRARQRLEAALQQARLYKTNPLILKYTNELHSFFLKQGDPFQALRYLEQYHAIQDSLNAMNTKARIASFEIEQNQQEKENEIAQLQTQKTTLRNYYLFASFLLLMIVLGVFSRLRYKRKRDKEQLTTDFKNQLAQAETKALRSQMNPHFIFNSLNSINNFVTDQKHEIASDYLLKFSKLIRLILDNSRSETIPLDKELETLQLYVQLESIRFENHFKYVVNIAENTSAGSIMIPPMLLQPFIENAIWHGLMQKRTKGTITVDIRKENEKFLNISITDDGIGREKAAEMKSKSATHRSHGMKVTSERIEMMNKLNSTGAKVHIIDLKDEQSNALGTRVELTLPI